MRNLLRASANVKLILQNPRFYGVPPAYFIGRRGPVKPPTGIRQPCKIPIPFARQSSSKLRKLSGARRSQSQRVPRSLESERCCGWDSRAPFGCGSAALASGTIKRTARRLDQTFNGFSTNQAGLAAPIVNPQSFFVVISCAGRPTKVE